MSNAEQIAVLKKFADVLDGLRIEYAIGGSIASSLYGTVRFTQDADITVADFRNVAGQFYEALKDEFYLSKEAMTEALDSCGSFNAIHLESGFKIDVFVQGPSEFYEQVLARRKQLSLSEAEGQLFNVISAEDVVLLKLHWYAQSGCASDRQWDDVLGVLRVQGKSLDSEYMMKWSRELAVDELLQRAISELKEQ
jgi:hypothetical protein